MKKIYIFCLLSLLYYCGYSQTNELPIKPTDFSIPSSPAFGLLDVNPSKINKPGFTKDFKLDWIIKDKNIAPDIALEVLPIWLLFYDKTNANEYIKQNWFLKTLSTTNFSLGTVKKDSIQSLAYSFKLTLFKGDDPIKYVYYKENMHVNFSQQDSLLTVKISRIDLILMDTTISKDSIRKLYEERIKLLNERDDLTKSEYESLKRVNEEYNNKVWNSTIVEIGFGNVYNYFSTAYFDSLSFNNKGLALWLNGCYGFKSEKWLLSGLLKYSNIDKKEIYTGGLNLRYGSSKTNFFIEGVYDKIDKKDLITIAYGGDYKINNKTFLQFGIRTEYDKNFTFKRLVPLINFSYLIDKE